MQTNRISNKASWSLSTLIVFLISIQISFASEQIAPGEKGMFDLWNYQEIIDVKLTFDLEEVFQDRKGIDSHPAKISFEDERGIEQDWEIKLSTRGRFRKMKCNEIPPLKINFRKTDLRSAGLADFDDFKLVTHCLDDHQLARELLLKEYLTYRLFNQLTDVSYRVQLVNITYEDISTGERKEQLGFLIEDTAQLRARIEAEKMDAFRVVDQKKYEAGYSRLVAMFQYLIGNADWGLTFPKNITYLEKADKVLPVPYDFDFAALVNAPYMTVPSKFHLNSRYERIYLGFERSQSDLKATIHLLEEQKDQLYATIMELDMLPRSSRTGMIKYLNSFYKNTKKIRFADN